MHRKTVLVVGAGNVGRRVIARLRGHARVFALTRATGRARRAALRQAGAQAVAGNLDRPASLAPLRRLALDAVVHLAPPPAAGTRDSRTRHLLRAILPKHPRRFAFVYVSTTGVYGDCAGARFDESRPVHPQTARARRRVDAERVLAAAAKRNGWHASILRAPGIYDAQHLPLARLAARTPAPLVADDVHTGHVHADDLAAMCVAALRSKRRCRVYHACDDSELRMGEYFDLVADAFGLPRAPRLPRVELERALDAASLSFMRESRRPGNGRIKRELGFRFAHPQVAEFVRRQARDADP